MGGFDLTLSPMSQNILYLFFVIETDMRFCEKRQTTEAAYVKYKSAQCIRQRIFTRG